MLAFQVLPSLVEAVSDEQLKQAVEQHLRETRAQSERAERAFRALGLEPSSNRSGPLEAIAKQHDELAKQIVQPALRDVFNAAAAAATERYELSLYEATIDLAKALGVSGDAVDLLEESREEEERALQAAVAARERLAGRSV